MKIAKAIANIFLVSLTAYLGLFLFWFLMAAGCVQYTNSHNFAVSECRENTLTQVVLVIHKPLINFLFGQQIK